MPNVTRVLFVVQRNVYIASESLKIQPTVLSGRMTGRHAYRGGKDSLISHTFNYIFLLCFEYYPPKIAINHFYYHILIVLTSTHYLAYIVPPWEV